MYQQLREPPPNYATDPEFLCYHYKVRGWGGGGGLGPKRDDFLGLVDARTMVQRLPGMVPRAVFIGTGPANRTAAPPQTAPLRRTAAPPHRALQRHRGLAPQVLATWGLPRGHKFELGGSQAAWPRGDRACAWRRLTGTRVS
jgi:hypothetical protein